jgi:hypothetical protein
MAIDFKKEIIPDDSDKLLAFRGDVSAPDLAGHYSSQYESGRIYYEKDSYHGYGTLKIRI